MSKQRTYAVVAKRVTDAVLELNAAIEEAFEHTQTRVRVGTNDSELPAQFGCEVTRITKHQVVPTRDHITTNWRIVPKEWKAVSTKIPKKNKKAKSK